MIVGSLYNGCDSKAFTIQLQSKIRYNDINIITRMSLFEPKKEKSCVKLLLNVLLCLFFKVHTFPDSQCPRCQKHISSHSNKCSQQIKLQCKCSVRVDQFA